MRVIALCLISLGVVLGAPDSVKVSFRRLATRSEDGVGSVSLSVAGQGQSFNAELKNPSNSVFSKNFQYTVANSDGSFTDDTPDEDTLNHIESQIFVDGESNSAVSVDGDKVSGILDNVALIPSKDEEYQIVNVRSAPDGNDYVDLHRQIDNSTRPSTRAGIAAQPEIWVIFDYDNSQLFKQDRNKILDYLGVFFHAINNRYATIPATEMTVSFRIAGVTTVSARSAQPYLENNKVPYGSGNDINAVLDAFSQWAYTNQASGPKFDMAAVISGVDFQTKDSSGVYSKSVAGLAYLSAACWKTTTKWYATSVTEDRGGYYDGMFSVAHEFAHNLGAPHDGSDGAASCSWEDGYIMSYKGWGTLNKFKFSSCSISLMKTYISSSQGSCVKSIQSSTNIPISNDNVGDRLNMTQLCVKYTGQAAAVPEPTKTADQLCSNLSCRYPTPGKPAGYFSIVTLNHPPGDNTPCGTAKGKCTNGLCVVPPVG